MMGLFDTLVDGDTALQVKCFGGDLAVFNVGDKVPKLHRYEGYKQWSEKAQFSSYTIVNDPYDPRYAVIENRIFMGFETDKKRTKPPYVARYGVIIV